jgi:hypothetical protein
VTNDVTDLCCNENPTVTNDVTDLCCNENPKAKKDSSSIGAIVDTYAVSSLLGKQRTTAIVQPTIKTASPVVAVALPPPLALLVGLSPSLAKASRFVTWFHAFYQDMMPFCLPLCQLLCRLL